MALNKSGTIISSIPWTDDDISWSTTESPFTTEEEDAIVTIVVVVVGVVIAIIALFSMGIFIDCKHQKSGSPKQRDPLRLKMPPMGRARMGNGKKKSEEDVRSLASDMCPNGSTDPESRYGTDAIV